MIKKLQKPPDHKIQHQDANGIQTHRKFDTKEVQGLFLEPCVKESGSQVTRLWG